MLANRLKQRQKRMSPPKWSSLSVPSLHSSLGFRLWLKSRMQKEGVPSGQRLSLSTLSLYNDLMDRFLEARYWLNRVSIPLKPLIEQAIPNVMFLHKLGVIRRASLGLFFKILRKSSLRVSSEPTIWEPP